MSDATEPSPDGRRIRVAFFGTYDAEVHPRVRVLEQGLRAHGVETVECNEPLRLGTAERLAMLRRPWTAHRLVARILRCWVALARRRARVGRVDALVVGYLGHFDVLLARCLFPGRPVALDFLVSAEETAVDRRADPRSPTVAVLRQLDRLALGAAAAPIVDTRHRLTSLPPRARRRAVVAWVGATEEWHEVSPAPADEQMAVVFFGLFTPLQGAPTIGRAISRLADRADIRFTMVGTGQDSDSAREATGATSHVRWRPWCPPSELPALAAAHHLCLGIFGAGEKARRVVPNKVFQGAAAGCAIVTSDTPAQREALGEAAVYVPPEDPDSLAEALSALADDRDRLAWLRRAARARAQEAFRPVAVAEPLHRWLAA